MTAYVFIGSFLWFCLGVHINDCGCSTFTNFRSWCKRASHSLQCVKIFVSPVIYIYINQSLYLAVTASSVLLLCVPGQHVFCSSPFPHHATVVSERPLFSSVSEVWGLGCRCTPKLFDNPHWRLIYIYQSPHWPLHSGWGLVLPLPSLEPSEGQNFLRTHLSLQSWKYSPSASETLDDIFRSLTASGWNANLNAGSSAFNKVNGYKSLTFWYSCCNDEKG